LKKFIVSILANWVSLIILSTFLNEWLIIDFPLIAFLAAIILSLLNLIVRPILAVLTIPLNALTLGLFSFILNALILYSVSILSTLYYPGFEIVNFFPAAFFLAIIMSIINWLVKLIVKAI
jgi:putative membrane protein